MSCAFSLLESCHLPCSRYLSTTFRFSRGCYQMPRPIKHKTLCLCKNMQTVACELVKASYVPAPQTKPKDQSLAKVETIGAFQKLPMVMPSVDIFQSASRKAKRVLPTKGIANVAKRERNRGAKQLDALMKELAVPLRGYIENFPKRIYLHPYERSLIELTFGAGNYEEVLKKVDALRKKVVSVGKEHASLCAKSLSKKEAEERLTEGLEKLQEIFKCEGQAIDDLLYIAKTLRAMPVVDLEMPTLCLVGAPNVGKSSLVRLLSTGKPEVCTTTCRPRITVWDLYKINIPSSAIGTETVCNYPFTTRGILMGHITLDYQHFQVTDTPGLLKRCDEDRNNLEKLTLAVLSHLPTAILYVHDLSGQCGMSPSDQFIIYKEISERFGNHLWLDVISKCDLLKESPVVFITEDREVDHLELAKYRKIGPKGALRVSVKNEDGIDKLKTKVHELLMAQMERIKSKRIQDNIEVA
ncbi:nucleolar GTP-binding protein 1-like isoform X1 [Gossypium australe]|uniref:Nucleolar GTP-binding protein 1-like isoform X1 n=1 Tax=Gossypium australe TaxID=47621 RepID=A0A5B6UMT7_9ROSI|nr:nucleolar GTP-binding protein 1-like isoform X1 [Gossypium australe]